MKTKANQRNNVCYGLNYVPLKKKSAEVLTPVFVTGILFGNRVLADDQGQ